MAKTGINDLWTTRPDVAKLLKNKDLGYIFSKSSNEKVEFICPICGEIVTRSIGTVSKNGLICPYCSWEKSFGEKIIRRILIALKVDYTPEKSFNWSNKKRYDFYLNDSNSIIEVHGAQHYYYTGLSCRTLEEEQENDKWKYNTALKNGIIADNYIIIDARDTSLNSIKSQLLNCNLSKIYDFNKLDWEEYYKLAFNSVMKETCELWNATNYNAKTLANILKISVSTVVKYLKIGYEIGLCKKYNWKEVNNDHSKKIICLTTNEQFNSMSEAEEKYSITLINGACKGRYTYRGEIDNKPLVWMFLIDYEQATNEEINERIDKAYKVYYRSSVVCLNNKTIYYNADDALNYANLKTTKTIFDCCNGKQSSAGRDAEGNPLVWVRYVDFLKMTDTDIELKLNNIIVNSYRKIICVDNKKIFMTMKDACLLYGINMGNLCDCIRSKTRKTCGVDENNNKLHWMYYEDYVKEFGEVC